MKKNEWLVAKAGSMKEIQKLSQKHPGLKEAILDSVASAKVCLVEVLSQSLLTQSLLQSLKQTFLITLMCRNSWNIAAESGITHLRSITVGLVTSVSQ